MDKLPLLKKNIEKYLKERECEKTFEHCINVGNYASKIGENFLNEEERNKVKIAGYLHDISAVYPNHKRIEVSERLGIEILEEERKFPMIIHQKISKVMAQDIFNIQDNEILSAIECHTTLKKNYSKLDLVLFVADKIKWDQEGEPPYLKNLLEELKISFERAAFYYINYILNNGIKVPHPWLLEANRMLRSRLYPKFI